MAFCEKCGAMLADDMKFCDKCGVRIEHADEAQLRSDDGYGFNVYSFSPKNLLDKAKAILPSPLTTPGDKTMLYAGFGCMALLALVYIICMFVFMADICLPIGLGSDAFMPLLSGMGTGNSGASSIWLLLFLVFSLLPAVFTAYAFYNRKLRLYAVFASAFVVGLTLVAFVAWLISAPGTVAEAIIYYSGPNKYAWYVLNDALSEVWYLKIILAAGSFAGFGVDYLVNKDQ